MALALIVTIDTEEEGCFSGRYPTTGQSCKNVLELARVQVIFERLGVVPTYLVDYPVVMDAAARDLLRGFAAAGSELGAHLHPWCTPPLVDGGAVYAHRLPGEVLEAKLRVLRDAIEEAFGARPTSYRAGRWGFDHGTLPILERLGFRVDTSVCPLWWSADGDVGFSHAPLAPYHPHRDDVCRRGDAALIEAPVTAATTGRWRWLVDPVAPLLGPRRGLRRLLRGLGLVSLKPEQFPLERMRRLADEVVVRGGSLLNLMFHSSAMLPGATPFVRDRRELDRFLSRVEGILEHCIARLGATPAALSSLATVGARRGLVA